MLWERITGDPDLAWRNNAEGEGERRLLCGINILDEL